VTSVRASSSRSIPTPVSPRRPPAPSSKGSSTEHHRRAPALARDIDDPGLDADILNSSGETLNAAGRPEDAQACHDSALAPSRTHGIRHEEGRALDGIAQALHNTGRPVDARAHWQQALAIYTELSVPEAATVRTQLAELGDQEQ
jgi:tetratricopeptide (TPR) repeat protein